MSDEIEALGDAITGGVLAHALEPEAGDTVVKTEDTNCLNCHAPLSGNHCHHCGQKAKVHRTLAAFGHDLVHGVLHFDGKIWRTLPMLVWNPGDLTRRYIHGERAKFVSPLALFLFCVFLMFAAFSFMGEKNVLDDVKVSANASINRKQSEIRTTIANLREKKQQAAQDQQATSWIDDEIARNQVELDNLRSVAADAKTALARLTSEQAKAQKMVAVLEKKAAAPDATPAIRQSFEAELENLRGLERAIRMANTGVAVDSGNFTNIDVVGNSALSAMVKNALKNPQLLLYKMKSGAYKFSWALIPISIPLVWLLFFWRREFPLFDHAIFVTYSLCFMMLLVTLSGVLDTFAFAETIALMMLVIIPPIHMYRQLKHAYRLTTANALWRTMALTIFALMALAIFALLIFLLGLN